MQKSKRILSIALTIVMILSTLASFCVTYAQTGSEFVIGDVRVQTLSDTIVRVELKGTKGFEDRLTYHIVNRNFGGAVATLTEGDTVTTVETDSYTVSVPNGATSLKGVTISKKGKTIWEYTTLPDASNFLPDPADTPDAYAIADNPRVVPSEWGYNVMPEGETDENDRNGWDTSNNAPDMYVFLTNGDAKQLRADFNALTGSTELVPLKALGLWYSRYHAYSAETAIAQIQKFRNEGFPLDYFVVDTDWKASASTGYDINTELFPDMQGFINQAQTEEHVNIVFNDHPVASVSGANTLAQSEVVYRNTNLRKYLNMGINAWWYDRNWPNSIPSPIPGITSDSFGMYLYHNITQSERPNVRPMILANVDGINNGPLVSAPNLAAHRYSMQWTDDIKNTPDYLKQEIENAVILGATAALPYVSSDVGGHSGVNSPVLYTRWTQYAALSSVFRFHSSNQDIWDRAPWLYGEDAENTTRDYIKMRYNLLPLYYSLAHENYESGMPILRRLDFNYPVYPEALDNTQYTLGDNILVAPIWEDGDNFSATASRQVFIPDGRWIDVWSGEEYVGPQTITVSHSAKTSPIFVRSGTVLALANNDIDYIEDGSWQDITLDVYPSTKLSGSTVLYEDDETSVGYKNGQYRTTDITTSYDGTFKVNIGKAVGTYDGSDEFSTRNWTVRVHAPESFGAVTGLTLNGESVEATKIEKVTDAMPFATNGGALDSDVYEVTFTAALDAQSEITVDFETPVDEYVPEYSTVKADYDMEGMLTPDSVDFDNTTDWVYFGSEKIIRKLTNDSVIENIKVDDSATYTDSLINAKWSDGDPITSGDTNKALAISDGEISFDVPVDADTKYITLYVGGENSSAQVTAWDGSNSGCEVVNVSNLYGKYAKKVVIEASSETATNIHICYKKTAGDGTINIIGATVANSKDTPVKVDYTTEVEAIPASVDFTNDTDVIDYVHLGAGTNVKSINRKNNVNPLVSDVAYIGTIGTVSDYLSPFTYSDATPTASVSASKNAIFAYERFDFNVRSINELRELKVYVGAYQSTLKMEVFDDAGSTVSEHILTATSTQRRVLKVRFKSETDSILRVRLTCLAQTKDTGNIALAAYSVSKVAQTSEDDITTSADLTITQSPSNKTVNFDAANILDYMHLGYNGTTYVAGAVNQKTGATLLSAPVFSNTCAIVGNSGFSFTYTDAESNVSDSPISANGILYANNAGSGNVNNDYIEFSAESIPTERLLTAYFGAYRADARVDVYDADRNLLTTKTLTGTASTNYQSVFTVKYSSDTPSRIYVRITESADYHSSKGNGNISLAGYSVQDVISTHVVLGYKDTNSVNLNDEAILDYVHLGYAGKANASDATAQYSKDLDDSEKILSNVTGTYKATYNSQPKFTFGTATDVNTSFYVDTIGNFMQYTVKSTNEWKKLTMYTSTWNSDASVEVIDESGNVIDTKTIAYANRNDGKNNRAKYTLEFKSETERTFTVRVTLLKQYSGGNVGITGYYVTNPVLSSIAVTKAPEKSDYFVGENFDKTGMEITATYDTGRTEIISDGFTTSSDFSSAENNAVTVSYAQKTTTYNATVKEKQLEKIEIATAPAKLDYYHGDAVDTDGIEVLAYYNNGDVSDVTAYVQVTADLSDVGKQFVTLSYNDKTVNYSVNVTHKLYTVAQKQSTCSESGYSEHIACEICDYTEGKTDYSKLGHNIVKIDAKQPTKDEAGYKEHYMCEVCGEYFEDEDTTKLIADIDAWKSGDGQLTFKVAVNEATGEEYPSISDALENAKEGEVVKLTADVTENNVIIDPGVTLDLNGFKLTAKRFIGLKDSSVIDTSYVEDRVVNETHGVKGATKTGGIYVDKDSIVLQNAVVRDEEAEKNISYMPIYDGVNGCYKFVYAELRDNQVKVDKNNFTFMPIIGENAGERNGIQKDLLGTDNILSCDLKLGIKVTWVTDGYYATQEFVMKEEMTRNFVNSFGYVNGDKYVNNYNTKNSATFTGAALKQADYVYISAVITTESGAKLESIVTEVDTSTLS